jgi:hypothetical protein
MVSEMARGPVRDVIRTTATLLLLKQDLSSVLFIFLPD